MAPELRERLLLVYRAWCRDHGIRPGSDRENYQGPASKMPRPGPSPALGGAISQVADPHTHKPLAMLGALDAILLVDSARADSRPGSEDLATNRSLALAH